jgi:DNA-binding response OmpR family regulator
MPEIKKKILVVEDDGSMREIVSHKLELHGFEVIQAEDGKVALELFQQKKPDLVLLDLMLPEVDGFAVLENIRKNSDPGLSATPVIILSNVWNDKDILRCKCVELGEPSGCNILHKRIRESPNTGLRNVPNRWEAVCQL